MNTVHAVILVVSLYKVVKIIFSKIEEHKIITESMEKGMAAYDFNPEKLIDRSLIYNAERGYERQHFRIVTNKSSDSYDFNNGISKLIKGKIEFNYLFEDKNALVEFMQSAFPNFDENDKALIDSDQWNNRNRMDIYRVENKVKLEFSRQVYIYHWVDLCYKFAEENSIEFKWKLHSFMGAYSAYVVCVDTTFSY